MASLSDQIDRLSQNTRSIKATASSIASATSHETAFPGTFTRAVLNTHLGDLIRDVDPSELGLFRLVQGPSNDTYNKESKNIKEPNVRRTEFTAATPLRKNPSRRDDKQEIQPEIYAHAALKYIEQYEPIRPMPRAYDQIVAILNKLNAVRVNINTLSESLEKAAVGDKAPSTKARVEQEEKRLKELQARIAELSKLKEEKAAQARKPVATRLNTAPQGQRKEQERQKTPMSPSSPMEDKFWATKGEPSRTLRFSENLLDEEVNLGDMSTDSFGTPIAIPAQVPRLSLFADPDFVDEPTITQFPQLDFGQAKGKEPAVEQVHTAEIQSSPSPASIPSTPKTPSLPLPPSVDASMPSTSRATETPRTKQRKIKMNPELEKVVSKIWSGVGDIILPSYTSDTPRLSVKDTIAFLEDLSMKAPQSESPSVSSASSASVDGTGLPTLHQIQIAYFLTMLFSSSNYSMPLNTVKENLALKAKSYGAMTAGTGPTKALFACMGKRIVKIDRGGGEQIVKFDIS